MNKQKAIIIFCVAIVIVFSLIATILLTIAFYKPIPLLNTDNIVTPTNETLNSDIIIDIKISNLEQCRFLDSIEIYDGLKSLSITSDGKINIVKTQLTRIAGEQNISLCYYPIVTEANNIFSDNAEFFPIEYNNNVKLILIGNGGGVTNVNKSFYNINTKQISSPQLPEIKGEGWWASDAYYDSNYGYLLIYPFIDSGCGPDSPECSKNLTKAYINVRKNNAVYVFRSDGKLGKLADSAVDDNLGLSFDYYQDSKLDNLVLTKKAISDQTILKKKVSELFK